MGNPLQAKIKILKPLVIFSKLLAIITVIEALIMLCLPLILPETPKFVGVFSDSLILAALSSPFIWLLIARPLRAAVLTEIDRTEAMLENIVEAVINFDMMGNITSLNSAAIKMFGYQPSEIIGQRITRIIPELSVDPRTNSFLPDLEETAVHNRQFFEISGCRNGKAYFPAEVSISRFHMQGQLIFMAIIHDITECKRLEASIIEQKEFAENLVHNNAVPTFVLGRDHRILLWNKACEELTGVKAESVLSTDSRGRPFSATSVLFWQRWC